MPWLVNIDEAIHGTAWFNSLYRSPFSTTDLCNLLLVNTDMNPVCWTLRVELMVALVLPLLHALTRKTGAWCDLSCSWYWIEHSVGDNGFSLARSHGVRALSACALITCLVYGPDWQWFRCLDVRWLRLLGQVPYSFYLVHIIILYCMARGVLLLADTGMMTDIPPLALIMLLAAFSCPVAIVLARLIFVWIEPPFMLLGSGYRRGCEQSLLGVSIEPRTKQRKGKEWACIDSISCARIVRNMTNPSDSWTVGVG